MGYLRKSALGAVPVASVRPNIFGPTRGAPGATRPGVFQTLAAPAAAPVPSGGGRRGWQIHLPAGLVTALTPKPPVVTEQPPPPPPPKATSGGTSSGGGGGGGGGVASPVTPKPPSLPAAQGPSDLPDGSGGGGLPMNTILIVGGAALAAYLIFRSRS